MCEIKTGIIVFTGNGKGKTTSALGLAAAAAMNGKKAVVVQFLKGGGYTGELFAAAYLAPNFIIRQFGYGCPIAAEIKAGTKKCCKCGLCFRENRNPGNGFALKALSYAQQILLSGEADVLVLDEISHAMRHGLIQEDWVIELIQSKPAAVTLVLTGRNMTAAVLKLADHITVCEAVKHPMADGIDARRGIEY